MNCLKSQLDLAMRRGLISHSKAELPDAVLDARIELVRAAMREPRLDVLVLYSNNTRPAAVSWLTGFVPYWSEALLVVPRSRPPVLVAALTYRVKSWIERVSRVAEVMHTPRVGLEAGRLLANAKADAAVGIADRDGLAAGIADDLRAGGPRLAFSDATSLFERLRAVADPAEIALAAHAAAIAARASRAPPRWAKASRCAPASPTRARGFGCCARSATARMATRRPPDWRRRSRSFRASAALPAARPGWSKAAGSPSRSRRSWARAWRIPRRRRRARSSRCKRASRSAERRCSSAPRPCSARRARRRACSCRTLANRP